jgi:hypothetical protein
MRCYLVTAKSGGEVLGSRIASTNADAREVREDLMTTFEVKKKDVDIEAHEVPLAKSELIEYLNVLLIKQDVSEGSED